LPNNLNFSILDIEGEAMLLYLDEMGVQAATGSACNSESLEPSHVLLALGMPYELAHGSLRFTLGHCNTKADMDYVLKIMPGIVEKLRELSPVRMSLKKGEERPHPEYKKHK
ncbi:MAG: aminotransferase class V-fold PLP-dependent enzyme, partial [Candidatus Magasanikbacteria bacterium]|nr:aminotransferase class V-fold PLP-dependent enzyme [Candidatus Magasanikbacteria bacterium]